MMNRYISKYPNQVHQLSVYISKNYHLLKSGEIKYQIKKNEVNWQNYEKTGKHHLVSFVIRDHCSGCFYAEIHSIYKLPQIKEFLFNAWCKKKNYEFFGVPENLIIGRHILQMWPELTIFSKKFSEITVELAENGFATAVRASRDWENSIKYYTLYDNYKKIGDFQSNSQIICRDINNRQITKNEESNLEKWKRNPKGVFLIKDHKESFYNSFL